MLKVFFILAICSIIAIYAKEERFEIRYININPLEDDYPDFMTITDRQSGSSATLPAFFPITPARSDIDTLENQLGSSEGNDYEDELIGIKFRPKREAPNAVPTTPDKISDPATFVSSVVQQNNEKSNKKVEDKDKINIDSNPSSIKPIYENTDENTGFQEADQKHEDEFPDVKPNQDNQDETTFDPNSSSTTQTPFVDHSSENQNKEDSSTTSGFYWKTEKPIITSYFQYYQHYYRYPPQDNPQAVEEVTENPFIQKRFEGEQNHGEEKETQTNDKHNRVPSTFTQKQLIFQTENGDYIIVIPQEGNNIQQQYPIVPQPVSLIPTGVPVHQNEDDSVVIDAPVYNRYAHPNSFGYSPSYAYTKNYHNQFEPIIFGF